jgi:oligoendopeptidase F
VELGHYSRHLYHIVKYVNESAVSDKKKYTDIIQAQMSDNELYATLYNAISEYRNTKFLPLLDKYGFFENIRNRGKVFDRLKEFFTRIRNLNMILCTDKKLK